MTAGLRALAEELAVAGGQLALDGRAEAREAMRLDRATKSSLTDLVTEYDRAAEELIVAEIRRARPGDGIVGEEGTDDAGVTGYVWFIDPIDGTTNFVYDQPGWSCSVAVAHGATMVAGAVHVPPLGELFSAAAGDGATLDGRPIEVSDTDRLDLALVGTGFAYRSDVRRAQGRRVASLIGEVRDIRRIGSAAFDLCMVACGRLDAYYEEHLNPWDAAAGLLIATEAGAIASDFAGGAARHDQLVVASPGVHAPLVALLNRVDPAY